MRLLGAHYTILRPDFALLVIALAAPFGSAEAACDRPSPIDNSTITCTGTTTNANGTNGYGSDSDTGNTYNILSGASISGTGNGLRFETFGTVNNAGTITGAGANLAGVSGQVRGTVNNSGSIVATGAGSAGVIFDGTGVVNNSGTGTITGGDQGVRLENGEVTNAAGGSILGGVDGVNIHNQTKVSNAGLIAGGQNGVSIGDRLST